MTKFKLRKGWTKRKMLNMLLKGNNGTVSSITNSSGGDCVYRGPNGNKCAAGCFIPDKDYDPVFDRSGGLRVDLLPDKIIAKFPLDLKGMDCLQTIHDQCTGDTHELFREFVKNRVRE